MLLVYWPLIRNLILIDLSVQWKLLTWRWEMSCHSNVPQTVDNVQHNIDITWTEDTSTKTTYFTYEGRTFSFICPPCKDKIFLVIQITLSILEQNLEPPSKYGSDLSRFVYNKLYSKTFIFRGRRECECTHTLARTHARSHT
jgi:hypothetical protein